MLPLSGCPKRRRSLFKTRFAGLVVLLDHRHANLSSGPHQKIDLQAEHGQNEAETNKVGLYT